MSPEAAVQPSLSDRLTLVADDDQLVDRIIYLGSLASAQEAIDPIIEPLREITARREPGSELRPQDRMTLRNIEKRLREFLIAEDPLRSFNETSLEQRLQQQRQTDADLWDVGLQSFVGIILLSLASAGLAFILPLGLSFETRFLVSVPLFFVVLHIGIAWFYLSSLNNFNQDIRRAFVLICAGIVLLSLAFSHYVFIQLIGGGQTYDWLAYGGITWLFGIPFMLIYLGLRIYGKLLKVTSRFMSLKVAFGIAALAALLIIFVPHPQADNALYFNIFVTGAAMIPVFALQGSALMHEINRRVTINFAKPVRWLYRYTMLVGLGGFAATLALFLLGELQGTALNIVTAVCGVPPQLLLLYTGYSFKRETSR